jgi:broad specificity phosphatase PhoE
MGGFAYVAASLIPRTVETALAMGFAVDDLLDFGGGEMWEAATSEISHRQVRDDPELYRTYLSLVEAGGAVAALGQRQVGFWTGAAQKVRDGEAALVVTHGGLIEPGLVVALPGWSHERWGRGFRQCEGARLVWSGGRFVDADVLHLDRLE